MAADIDFLNSPHSSQIQDKPKKKKKSKQPQQIQIGLDPALDNLGRTFAPGVMRRTIGGKIEDPTKPEGIDWLKANGGAGQTQSWNEPKRGVGVNLAAERAALAQIMDPVQRVGSGDMKAIFDPRYMGKNGNSASGIATNIPTAHKFETFGGPGGSAGFGGPLLASEKQTLGSDLNDIFSNLRTMPDAGPIMEQARLAAGRRPMSGEGGIQNANFDLIGAGVSKTPRPLPTEPPLPARPPNPRGTIMNANFDLLNGQPDAPNPYAGLNQPPLQPPTQQPVVGSGAVSQTNVTGFPNPNDTSLNWRNYSPLAQPNPHMTYNAQGQPYDSRSGSDSWADPIVEFLSKIFGTKPNPNIYRASDY